MEKQKIECPRCNEGPTGKYRDEQHIDGMYCRPCNVAWNVDWENEKPLYETTVDLSIDDYTVDDYIVDDYTIKDYALITEDDRKNLQHYTKDQHYSDLGIYLGIRETYRDKVVRKEHLFRSGTLKCGTAILTRILISEKPQQWL